MFDTERGIRVSSCRLSHYAGTVKMNNLTYIMQAMASDVIASASQMYRSRDHPLCTIAGLPHCLLSLCHLFVDVGHHRWHHVIWKRNTRREMCNVMCSPAAPSSASHLVRMMDDAFFAMWSLVFIFCLLGRALSIYFNFPLRNPAEPVNALLSVNEHTIMPYMCVPVYFISTSHNMRVPMCSELAPRGKLRNTRVAWRCN